MLRKRKNRRYNETNDEEGDGERKFDLQEQIKSDRFNQIKDKYLQELPGEAINLRLVQRNGFEKPILVVKPDGLDLRVPPKSFLVRDVRNCVGPQRIIDVMDVRTQKNIEMSMKDWCKYYESKNRDRLLNVISLEFSHTKLDELVDSPMIVKLLDWVDLVWPKFLKQSQTESTNSIDKMKYPKVQKYCLMSVKGSYTDFHIDFGGTSVWYHILRGKKIFWMVPPTELNLQIFEEWTLSGMQQDVFFGDTVEECFRVELCAGNTFFIPSGWIHAVYTIEDSLVFGGNFLHSFGIENQLKVSRIEDSTKVPIKFRYPFYTEILWYVVQHYVHCLMNKDHLHRPTESTSPASIKEKSAAANSDNDNKKNSTKKIEEDDDDESTESEYEESDTTTKTKSKSKKISKTAAAAKRKKPTRPAKSAPKKSKKPLSSDEDDDATEEDNNDDEDDESTDIDSANEELYKTPEKPTPNTCRMTKNSLLRLQYEIDEQQSTTVASSSASASATKKTTTATKGERNSSSGAAAKASKSKSSSPERQAAAKPPKAQREPTPPPQPTPPPATTTTTTTVANTSLNLADMMQETKLNGWPASVSGGHAGIWSNPNAEIKEPAHVHITKFEVNGLKVLVKHLSKLSGAKKNLPNLIRNSRALLDDCKKLIAEHENDDPELAVTGKAITPELLKVAKKADMNELIGQFFKTSEKDGSPLLQLEPANKLKSNDHHAVSASRDGDEKKSLNISGSSLSANDTPAGSSANPPSTKPSLSSSPHKETKCLSPSKKLSSLASSSATSSSATASPPPRPKSPPTRPLSNNQYTSKTKNNNNLLLPGSFADLIAATSTEKKVFDVNTAEVSASLFGMKDLASSKSASAQNSPKTTNRLSSSITKPVKSHSLLDSPAAGTSASSSFFSSTSTPAAGPTGSNQAISPEPPKAAVPPKRFITPMAFRPPNKEKLIYASAPYVNPVHASESRSQNPWQHTPQHPHPIQNQHQHQPYQPHQPHHQQQYLHQNAPTYSPALSSGSSHHNRPPAPSGSFHSSTTPHRGGNQQPASYTPDLQALNQQQQQQQPPATVTSREQNHDREEQRATTTTTTKVTDSKSCNQTSRNEDHKDRADNGSVIVASNHAQHQQASNGELVAANNKEAPIKTESKPPTDEPKVAATANAEAAKKPAKPRGPPKKSKEARQVAIESSGAVAANQQQTSSAHNKFPLPLIPISVIKSGPSTSSATTTAAPATPTVHLMTTSSATSAPSAVVPATTATATTSGGKTKTKRPKKQKDGTTANNSTATTETAALATAAHQLTTMAAGGPNQLRPSVICGLVRPPPTSLQQAQAQQQPPQKQQQPPTTLGVVTSMQGGGGAPLNQATAAGKLNPIQPQSYLLSRPLFSFPSMPAFSAAQFQQLQQQQQQQQHQQRPMNLLATPMSSHSLTGLPLQQGARWVLATQPNRLVSPMMPPRLPTSTSTAGAPPLVTQPSPAVASTSGSKVAAPSHSTDNAALLSLATTALSTAPLTSSPALSHLNNRTINPQALMMGTAANQQAAQLFQAGQQFFRPFAVQGMPGLHYAAIAQRPPTGATSMAGASVVTTAAGSTPRPGPGQLILARLPNQPSQQRYLLTQPGFMQPQRFQTPHIVTSQAPSSTLTYAAYKPPADTSKVIKTKKVKTS